MRGAARTGGHNADSREGARCGADMRSIYRWIYGLWYPTLLRTFGLSVLVDSPKLADGIGALPAWEWIVVLYLMLQYGEGRLTP